MDNIILSEVNFTREQLKASNEAIINSGKPYSSRMVQPTNSIPYIQLIQDRPRRRLRSVEPPTTSANKGSWEYEIDLW